MNKTEIRNVATQGFPRPMKARERGAEGASTLQGLNLLNHFSFFLSVDIPWKLLYFVHMHITNCLVNNNLQELGMEDIDMNRQGQGLGRGQGRGLNCQTGQGSGRGQGRKQEVGRGQGFGSAQGQGFARGQGQGLNCGLKQGMGRGQGRGNGMGFGG
ncbi:MAG: hypothetical protein KAT62_09615 [Desulfuromonadales bacterium]|nr:hypothetical protein [Desulfuromonadales bacterium]